MRILLQELLPARKQFLKTPVCVCQIQFLAFQIFCHLVIADLDASQI